MPTIIKGNLIMEKDIEYNGDLIVEGNILGKNGNRYNLKVHGNITARNISAGNISAGNIDAWDISAWNITAGNIDAGNISYYAVCFAYKNIKCKSIKGTRNNARHFVIDGKIEVVK